MPVVLSIKKFLQPKLRLCVFDVHHRHIVFTIPSEYRFLFRKDRKALNLLFVAARNTISLLFNKKLYSKIIKDKKVNPKDNYCLPRNYKHKIEFGMIASLHTFGRALNWNPHIHCLVPEVAYDPSTHTCKHNTFFSIEALRKYWQYEINRLMSLYFGKNFYAIKKKSYRLYNQGYYVYARYDKQESTKGKSYSKYIDGCVNYMMRHTTRPPMAQSRIIHYNKKTDEVTWYYDGHKTNERITINETGRELMKKMIIHILETGFHMVRYYGFYNNKEQDVLNRVHELLEQHQKFKRTLTQRKANLQYKLKKLRFRTLCQKPIIMICLNADVVILWTRSVLTIHLKEDTDTMTDTTEQFVLMKCEKCGYTENVPIHDILILRQLTTPDDTEDHLLCPSVYMICIV